MQVDRVSGISVADFRREYVRPGRPVVLTDAAAAWPALTRWTPRWLADTLGDAEVEVEIGNAVQGSNPRTVMTLAHYVDLLEQGEAEAKGLYLAGFDLFHALPAARGDVSFDLLPRPVAQYQRAWLGATGTVSGFHRDLGDNVLAQVHGRKLVKLVSPRDKRCMYQSRKYDFLTHCSDVDVDALDVHRFPRFADADVGDVVLEPGNVLFIPLNWWHYTRALSTSISVNSGGATAKDVVRLVPHIVGYALHCAHLYRWGWCACHQPKVPAARVLGASG